jgi:hypothetical protein
MSAGDDMLDEAADPNGAAPQRSGGLRFDLTVNVNVLVIFVVQFADLSGCFSICRRREHPYGCISGAAVHNQRTDHIRNGDRSTYDRYTKREAQIADLQAHQDSISQTVAATAASLASLNDNVNRILDLQQNG